MHTCCSSSPLRPGTPGRTGLRAAVPVNTLVLAGLSVVVVIISHGAGAF
jgi:hypothetical protein